MSTANEKTILTVNNIQVSVVKKDIKNLHLSVLPPYGKVRVTAPKKVTKEAIRLFIISRIPWIKKQQKKYLDQTRQSKREYVSGESHYYLGKPYRLQIIKVEKSSKVYLKGKNKLVMEITNDASSRKEELIQEWYRNELQKIADKILFKLERKMKIKINKFGIKRMKTRWGSCNQRTKTIWLNLELIKKPIRSIEYVLVHELCHIFEKKHNKYFADLMKLNLPKWEIYKNELNDLPLAHEEWNY